jgi:hypothetical protein
MGESKYVGWTGAQLDARSIYERILLAGNYTILSFISKKAFTNFRSNISNIKRNTEEANARTNKKLGLDFSIGSEELSIRAEVLSKPTDEYYKVKIYLAPKADRITSYLIIEDAPNVNATIEEE